MTDKIGDIIKEQNEKIATIEKNFKIDLELFKTAEDPRVLAAGLTEEQIKKGKEIVKRLAEKYQKNKTKDTQEENKCFSTKEFIEGIVVGINHANNSIQVQYEVATKKIDNVKYINKLMTLDFNKLPFSWPGWKFKDRVSLKFIVHRDLEGKETKRELLNIAKVSDTGRAFYGF